MMLATVSEAGCTVLFAHKDLAGSGFVAASISALILLQLLQSDLKPAELGCSVRFHSGDKVQHFPDKERYYPSGCVRAV